MFLSELEPIAEASTAREKSAKEGASSGKRIYFTVEENLELQELFKDFILKKKTPSPAIIEERLHTSKKNQGLIHKYSIRKITKKISNLNAGPRARMGKY